MSDPTEARVNIFVCADNVHCSHHCSFLRSDVFLPLATKYECALFNRELTYVCSEDKGADLIERCRDCKELQKHTGKHLIVRRILTK